jgi:hypothetical protein
MACGVHVRDVQRAGLSWCGSPRPVRRGEHVGDAHSAGAELVAVRARRAPRDQLALLVADEARRAARGQRHDRRRARVRRLGRR